MRPYDPYMYTIPTESVLCVWLLPEYVHKCFVYFELFIRNNSIRKFISKILKPNHELSEFIIKEWENQNWDEIITRIWPYTKYLDVVVTGM